MKRLFYTLMDADTGAGTGGQTEPKPMTFDEFLKSDPAHQAEFDRRTTKALTTARGNWEQEAEERVNAARTEAEKLAKMNAEQKAEHERQKREEELARREAELNRRELRAGATQTMNDKGLPLELLDVLDFSDAEACSASIDKVEKAFSAAVQLGVESRMKGTTPKGVGNGSAMTKAEIMKEPNYQKRQALIEAHKELFF